MKFFSYNILLSLKIFGRQIQWLYSQGHLDLQMTFKSWFLVLGVLQIKYLVTCTYQGLKFWAVIFMIINIDFDLQMTFKSWFLVFGVLQIKYLVSCTYQGLKILAVIFMIINIYFDLQMTFKSWCLILSFFYLLCLQFLAWNFKSNELCLNLTFKWPSNHDFLYWVYYK